MSYESQYMRERHQLCVFIRSKDDCDLVSMRLLRPYEGPRPCLKHSTVSNMTITPFWPFTSIPEVLKRVTGFEKQFTSV